MSIKYCPLSEFQQLSQLITFERIGVVMYFEREEIAYPLFNVSGYSPIMGDLGGNRNSDFIHIDVSNFIANKTCLIFSLNPEDILEQGYILYYESAEKSGRGSFCVVCIKLDLNQSTSEIDDFFENNKSFTDNEIFVMRLNYICKTFRMSFIKECKRNGGYNSANELLQSTHLLWIDQNNFNDILEDDNSEVSIPSSLQRVYEMKSSNDIPIAYCSNKKANCPNCISEYPPMEPIFLNFLREAYSQGINLFNP